VAQVLEYLPNKHKAQYWQKKGRKEGQEGGREKREGGREGKKPKGIEKFQGLSATQRNASAL
jgi:hypothetical protein